MFAPRRSMCWRRSASPEALPFLEDCAARFGDATFLTFAVEDRDVNASSPGAPPDMADGFGGRRAAETRPVSEEEFRRLCEFLYRRTGMVFTETKRYYVERRVKERMHATGAASFASYFARLRIDDLGEVEQFVNAFTVNETYFYREMHQLRCLTTDLLARRSRDGRPTADAVAHLVVAMLDRRRAVFDRDLAAGKLAAGRSVRYRDHRLRHRHAGAGGSTCKAHSASAR